MEKNTTKTNQKSKKKPAQKPATLDFMLSRKGAKLLVVIGLVICGIFIVRQVISIINKGSDIVTETAIRAEMYSEISVSGIALRSEKVVSSNISGTLVSCIPDGTKVKAGDSVSLVFSDSSGAESYMRFREVSEELEYYRGVSYLTTQTTVFDSTLYQKKVFESQNNLVSAVARGDYRSCPSCVTQLRTDIIKKQVSVGVWVDVSEDVRNLETEYSSLESYAQKGKPIAAPVGGTFYSFVDGYESCTDISGIKKLSGADIDNLLNYNPVDGGSSQIGKIVDSFNWYFACNIPIGETGDIEVGNNYYVTFDNSGVGTLQMKAVAMNEDKENDRIAVIFMSNSISSELVAIRTANVKIRTKAYSGLRIPLSAVRTVTDDFGNEKTGVYILSGYCCYFNEIKIVYSGTDYVLSEENETKSRYLKLYDQIIVQGRDLEDGKVFK